MLDFDADIRRRVVEPIYVKLEGSEKEGGKNREGGGENPGERTQEKTKGVRREEWGGEGEGEGGGGTGIR